MGDLFTKAPAADHDKLRSGKTLIIETHSEHIMLRLGSPGERIVMLTPGHVARQHR